MEFSVEESQGSGVGSFCLDVVLRLSDVLQFAHPQGGRLGEVAEVDLQRCFPQLQLFDVLRQAVDTPLRFLTMFQFIPKGFLLSDLEGFPQN